jgi:uncharacterized protein YjeT (DUF2065 family)
MSIYFIIAGITLILYTDWLRRLLQRMSSSINLRWIFPLPLIIGVLLILSKDLIPSPWFIIAIGILALAKGIYFLLSPRKQMGTLVNWWANKAKDITYRFWGIIILVLGITLFSWLR